MVQDHLFLQLVERLGSVDEAAVLGNQSHVQLQLLEHLVVEDVFLADGVVDGDVLGVLAVEDAQGHAGHGLAMVESADEVAPHGTVPQQVGPVAVEGHACRAVDDLQQFLRGVVDPVDVLEKGDEVDQGLLGKIRPPVKDLQQIEVRDELELQPPLEVGHGALYLRPDGVARGRGVADDQHLLHEGMELEGQLKSLLGVDALHHAADPQGTQPGEIIVVYAAKDRGHPGEQLVAILQDEVQGVVVPR